MNALIVVPVFNEADTVGDVVTGARAYAPVLVVDDGSRDGSADIARRAGADVSRHPYRFGKGEAIRTGIAAARARGASVVVTLDGDGQHRPSDLGRVLDAMRTMPRTIVIGGRLDEPDALPPDRLNAIRVAGFFVNWACGLRIRDTQSGFRAYPIELFDEIRVHRGGFVFETEVLVGAVARGWRVHEVPVAALPRERQRSRFRPISDGVAIGGYIAGRVFVRWALEAPGSSARSSWPPGVRCRLVLTGSGGARPRGRLPPPSRTPAPIPRTSATSTPRRTATDRARSGSVPSSTRRWRRTDPRRDR